MIDERKTRIVDINNKYVGSRIGTVRSNSFVPSPNIVNTVSGLPRPVAIGGSTVTRVGPVITLGRIPSFAPVGAGVVPIDSSPVFNRHIDHIDAHTPDFEVSGAIATRQPAEYWDNDVNTDGRRIGADVVTRNPSCFERLGSSCPTFCGCPWWVTLLLVLLALGALAAGILAYARNDNKGDQGSQRNQGNQENYASEGTTEAPPPTNDATNTTNNSNTPVSVNTSVNGSNETTTDRKQILNCSENYFLYNGKCLSCPGESKWNGTNCIKTQLVNTTTTTITNSSGIFVIPNENMTHPAAPSPSTESHKLIYDDDK